MSAAGFLSALLLVVAAPAPASDDVAATWNGADAYVRIENREYRFVVVSGPMQAPFMQRILDRLGDGDRRGVIVHLHDCAYRPGEPDVRQQARFMASLGYVVIVPNSFRRAGRPATCDWRRWKRLVGAPLGAVHRMRRDELAHAIERVRTLAWARRGRLIVSGYGEGAEAVMDYSHPAVDARIAIAATCRFSVDLSRPVPTLILTSRRDRWFRESRLETRADCRRETAGDPYVELFAPDGSLHNALIYRESEVVLWGFLARVGY